ncbi:MAG: hypothetical protein OXB86_02835 [Bdellovibrionales bacterium]|nr:hypothetical protein [Bdellovibrionales bacterium]
MILSDPIQEQLQIIIKENRWKRSKYYGSHFMETLNGSPWKDVPKELSPRKTAYNRFNQ